MRRRRLLTAYAILLSLFFTLFGHALFPSMPLFYAAPLLVWLYYSLSLSRALWASLGVGVLIDLLSSGHGFGTFALIYCLATSITYRAKPRFYKTGWATLPILTWGFCLVATLFEALLFALGGHGDRLSLSWGVDHLLLFPLIDAVWAFVGFTLPLRLLQLRRRVNRPIRLARPQ